MLTLKRKLLLSMVVMLSSLLYGCSMFAPVPPVPTSNYLLNATPAPVSAAKNTQQTLLVASPQTMQAYNTTHMVYTTQPYQLAYFAKSEWADTPTQMLQPLIVQTLQNTHSFRAVVSTPFVGPYDVMLNTQLLQLQQEFLQKPSQVRMTLRAQLISGKDNHVIATKEFSALVTAPQETPYGGVIAANRATQEILRQLALFCLAATQK